MIFYPDLTRVELCRIVYNYVERCENMKKNISYIVFIFLFILFVMFILSKCSNMTDSGIKKNIVGVVEDNKEILIEAISTGN